MKNIQNKHLPQLTELLQVDPDLKSGTGVQELISTKAKAGNEWSNILPKPSPARKKPPPQNKNKNSGMRKYQRHNDTLYVCKNRKVHWNCPRLTFPHAKEYYYSPVGIAQVYKLFLTLLPEDTDIKCNNKLSEDNPLDIQTYSDDVILAEAQLIIIMTFKVKKSLGTTTPIARHIDIVLQVKGMTLHAVVCLQVLQMYQKQISKLLPHK